MIFDNNTYDLVSNFFILTFVLQLELELESVNYIFFQKNESKMRQIWDKKLDPRLKKRKI